MLNLYWKTEGQTRTLVERPFQSEAEFESFVFQNQDILGDIYIVYRQIRTGQRQGIPDMLGVDQDANICIIEIKNVQANEDVLPQALGYAIWAETNPDSIKAIWLESKRKPEEIEVDWDNLSIRVILVAPSFKNTVPRMAGKLGYPIDLIQVRRFGIEQNELVFVEVLQEEPRPRVSTTKAMQEWDWEFYESEHGKEATAQLRTTVDAITTFVQQQGWEIQHNLNKYYVGFKLGNRLVLSVNWGGTYAWKVWFRIPEGPVRSFSGQAWELQSYDAKYQAATFRPLRPTSPDIEELKPLLVEAYRFISGAR